MPPKKTPQDDDRPAEPKPKTKKRAPPLRLASIVPGDLVQPSRDPATGLDIFPRLPEIDEDPGDVFSFQSVPSPAFASLLKVHESAPPAGQPSSSASSSSSSTTFAGIRRSFSLTGIFRSRSSRRSEIPRSTPCRPATASSRFSVDGPGSVVRRPGSASRNTPQPVIRREERSGGHVYCKHTLDERCRCRTILTLDQGDYCGRCWAGRCPAPVPYHLYPPPTSPADEPQV